MIALNLLSFLFPLILIGGLIYLALRGFGMLSGRYPGRDSEVEGDREGRYYRRNSSGYDDAEYDNSGYSGKDYTRGASDGSGYSDQNPQIDDGPSSVKDDDFYRQEHEVVDVQYEEEPEDTGSQN